MSVADVSHSRTEMKKADAIMRGNGKRKLEAGEGDQKSAKMKHQHVDWIGTPAYWILIEEAGKKYAPQMRATDIARHLQITTPGLFRDLTSQVVGRWIERPANGKPRWSEATLARAAKGYGQKGTVTRTGILVSKLDLCRYCCSVYSRKRI